MPLPQIAIVGRPNVGKSSLLNRLARRQVSIVDPAPGVTRDRVSAVIEIDAPIETPKGTPPKLVEITDTGGWGVYVADGKRYDDVGADLAGLTHDIETQIALAMDRSDLILFVMDGQAGVTSLDETIAKLLRERNAAGRVLPVANKIDSEEWVPFGLEAAAFGFGEPLCVSATSGRGMQRLMDAIWEHTPGEESEPESDAEMKLAIVGKRNSGKSTLINTLAGEERVIVSEIAGTTRDSVDVRFEVEGKSMIAIDTAGVRKRKSFADDIEYYAYHRMLQSIRRADVVMLLIDATTEVSQVDKKLAQELQRQYKPTIIVVNKCDRIDKDQIQPEDFLDYLTEQLRGLDYAPIVFISALKREGLSELTAMAHNLFQQAGHREGTGHLNTVVQAILKQRGPSSRLGTQAKLLFATQVSTHPPTIVLVVNHPKLFHGQYERYLLNRMREELSFSEIPIRVLFKKRTRLELDELKERGKEKSGAIEGDE
ncbi:MAG: ribosome biogenesis GTPase Der [Phycisphaerales bacterium]|nr:MAG: ribosome biogenesis GTPase Der [Phycisphaerales bacterium]